MAPNLNDPVLSQPFSPPATHSAQQHSESHPQSISPELEFQRNNSFNSDAKVIRSSMNIHQQSQQTSHHLQPQQHYQTHPLPHHQQREYAGNHWHGIGNHGETIVETNRRVPMGVVGNGNSMVARRDRDVIPEEGFKVHLQQHSAPFNPHQLYSSGAHAQPQFQSHPYQNQRQPNMARSSSHQGFSNNDHPPPPPSASSAQMNRTQSAHTSANISPQFNSNPANGHDSFAMERGNSNRASSLGLTDNFPSPQLSSSSTSASKASKSKAQIKSKSKSTRGKQNKDGRRTSAASGSRGGSVLSDAGPTSLRKSINRSRSGSVDSADDSDSFAASPDLGTLADIEAIDNRLGPCPEDFACPYCEKVYSGTHARSVWRRHLASKHKIPLADQPRRSRWDANVNRPKSKTEKRDRALASKRKWAKRDRLMKRYGKEEGVRRWEEEEKRLAEEGNGAGGEEYEARQDANRANALGLGLFEDTTPYSAFGQNADSQVQHPGQIQHPEHLPPSINDARWWNKSSREAANRLVNSSADGSNHQQLSPLESNSAIPSNPSFPASAPGGRILDLSLSSPRRAASEQGRSPPTSPPRERAPQSMAERSSDWLSGVAFASSSPASHRRDNDLNNLPAALTVPFNPTTRMNNNSSELTQSHGQFGSFGSGAYHVSIASAGMERSRSDLGPRGDEGNAGACAQDYQRRGSGTSQIQEFPSKANHSLSRERLELSRSVSYPIPSHASQPVTVGAPGSSSLIVPNRTPVTHYSDLYPTPPSMGNASSSGEPPRTVAQPAASPSGGYETGLHSNHLKSDLHKKRTGFGMSLGGQLRSLPWQACPSRGDQRSQDGSSSVQTSSASGASLVPESHGHGSQQKLLISPNKDKSDKMLSLSQIPPRSNTSISISKSQSHLGIPTGMDDSCSTNSSELNQFFNSGNATVKMGSNQAPPSASRETLNSLSAPLTSRTFHSNQLSSAFVPSAGSSSSSRDLKKPVSEENSKMEMEKPSPSRPIHNQARRFNPEESPLARRLKSSERPLDGPRSENSFNRLSPLNEISASRPNQDWNSASSQSLSIATSASSTLMGSTPKRKNNPFSLDQHKISPFDSEEQKRTLDSGQARTLPPLLGLTPLRSVSAPSKRKRGDDDDDEEETHSGENSAGASPLARRSSSSNHHHGPNGTQQSKPNPTKTCEEGDEENTPEKGQDQIFAVGKTPGSVRRTLFSSPANSGLASSLGLAPASDFRFASTPGRRGFDDSFGTGFTPSTLTRMSRMEASYGQSASGGGVGGSHSSNNLFGMGFAFTPIGNEKKKFSPTSATSSMRRGNKGANSEALDSSFSQFISSTESPFTSSFLLSTSSSQRSTFNSHSSNHFDSPSSLKRAKVSHSRKESLGKDSSKLKKLEYSKSKGKPLSENRKDVKQSQGVETSPSRSNASGNKKLIPSNVR